jgi:hypothetical protein
MADLRRLRDREKRRGVDRLNLLEEKKREREREREKEKESENSFGPCNIDGSKVFRGLGLHDLQSRLRKARDPQVDVTAFSRGQESRI